MTARLVTAKKAAEIIGCDPKTVYRLARLGILRYAPETKKIIRDSIDEWLEKPAVNKRVARMISKYGEIADKVI
jgi:hypothetical protein